MYAICSITVIFNRLRGLPAEIGDMVELRELYLNNNHLRLLPFEMGKLFQLQKLGKRDYMGYTQKFKPAEILATWLFYAWITFDNFLKS